MAFGRAYIAHTTKPHNAFIATHSHLPGHRVTLPPRVEAKPARCGDLAVDHRPLQSHCLDVAADNSPGARRTRAMPRSSWTSLASGQRNQFPAAKAGPRLLPQKVTRDGCR